MFRVNQSKKGEEKKEKTVKNSQDSVLIDFREKGFVGICCVFIPTTPAQSVSLSLVLLLSYCVPLFLLPLLTFPCFSFHPLSSSYS